MSWSQQRLLSENRKEARIKPGERGSWTPRQEHVVRKSERSSVQKTGENTARRKIHGTWQHGGTWRPRSGETIRREVQAETGVECSEEELSNRKAVRRLKEDPFKKNKSGSWR